MKLDIRYRCSFEYGELVRESQNELRACPISDHRQMSPHRSARRIRVICARALVPMDSAPLAQIDQVSQVCSVRA